MGDLLSSASLLVAIITVLYGLWNPAIKTVLNEPTPNYKSQCEKPLKELKSVLWNNAIPLTVASYTIVLVFAKDAITLIAHSFGSYINNGFGETLGNYNAVGTAFVLIVILILSIAIYLTSDCVKLIRKKRELRSVS